MAQRIASKQPEGFKSHVENIAIVGAGGTVGAYIVKSLAATGKHKITAITRPDSKNKLPAGLHAVKHADYADHASLVAALRGQDALVITMARAAPADTQTKLVNAAVAAGVRFVMPNEYGTDQTAPALTRDSILATRRHIEAAGAGSTSWIGLCCGMWYEYSLIGNRNAGGKDRYGFDFASKTVTFFDHGNTRVSTSMLGLCGDAVARLFTLPVLPEDEADARTTLSRFENSEVYVSSFTVSQRDMFASVLRVTGDTESDWTVEHEGSMERVKRGLQMQEAGNMAGMVVALYSTVFTPGAGADFAPKVMNELLGLPMGDLDAETRYSLRLREKGVLGP